MKVYINRESNTPVYMQIFEQVRRQIISRNPAWLSAAAGKEIGREWG
jgi:hypothetical protein